MKTLKRFTAFTVVIMMILTMTACNKYAPAKEYKNVTIGGLKLDIRSDMKYENSQKNAEGETLEGYYCNYFGVSVTSEAAAAFKLEGYNDAAAYLNCVIEANSLASEVKTSGDKCYIDYKNTVDGVEYTYSSYALELGYRYYMVQFFTRSGEEEEYRAEYEKILDTAELAEVPPETKEIVVSGVKMTVDGDIELDGENYYCSKYFVFALSDEMEGVTSDDFAVQMLKAGNFTKEDGTPVTSVSKIYDTITFYEYFDNDQYVYNYVKNIDSYVVYIMFATPTPADSALTVQFQNIVRDATLA